MQKIRPLTHCIIDVLLILKWVPRETVAGNKKLNKKKTTNQKTDNIFNKVQKKNEIKLKPECLKLELIILHNFTINLPHL